MINFLKKLFGLDSRKDQKPPVKVERINEYVEGHDMIDYDGMGNQGRFPTHK